MALFSPTSQLSGARSQPLQWRRVHQGRYNRYRFLQPVRVPEASQVLWPCCDKPAIYNVDFPQVVEPEVRQLSLVYSCGLVATSQLTTSSTSRSEWSEVNIFGGGEYTEVGKVAIDYRPVRVPETKQLLWSCCDEPANYDADFCSEWSLKSSQHLQWQQVH